ncbi:MAG: peptidase, partial [Hyphomicrobiales bacterium]|nr:peptidase [Hyphomicrobiales bacterium]
MSGLTRGTIVLSARRWIGTPYRHQASLLGVGCDCLGLVRGVWRDVVGAEPEGAGAYTPDWAEAGREERLIDAGLRWFVLAEELAFEAGDVLVFRWRDGLPAKHLGIATSSTTMIHAHDGACVCEVAIGSAWRRRIARAFA